MNKAKLFQVKVAFGIPEEYEEDGGIVRAIPDKLINELMDLFDDCEFEGANICNPPLIIVNTGKVDLEWIYETEKRINAVLDNWRKPRRKR